MKLILFEGLRWLTFINFVNPIVGRRRFRARRGGGVEGRGAVYLPRWFVSFLLRT